MDHLVLDAVLQQLSSIAPLRLAESWDNVGLLVGDRNSMIRRVMTCLTVTPEVVQEAIDTKTGLIVTHHPFPFKPLTRITSDSANGKMLLRLIEANVALYSAHTAFDSARDGINSMWANLLQLTNVKPLSEIDGCTDEGIGSGRYGFLEPKLSLIDFCEHAAGLVRAPYFQFVSGTVPAETCVVNKVAIACGSGGSFVHAAKRHGCDVLVTGEATFHQCLEAKASGLAMLLVGHYWSERFAMEQLARLLTTELSTLDVYASQHETDPMNVGISPTEKH